MNKIEVKIGQKNISTDVRPLASKTPIRIGAGIPMAAGPSFETYTHIQQVASASWVIEHNLNCYPSVSVVDTGGNVIIGDVLYETENKITVMFSHGFSGKAYLN